MGLVVGVSSSSLASPPMFRSWRVPFPNAADESKKGEGVVSGSTGKGTGPGGMVPFRMEWSRTRASCGEYIWRGGSATKEWTVRGDFDKTGDAGRWERESLGGEVVETDRRSWVSVVEGDCRCLLRSFGESGTFDPGAVDTAWDSEASTGNRPGGPTSFLRPLETTLCLCLVTKPLSATGMTFPSELSEGSKNGTSMGCIKECESSWLDSDWNRPLIGDRDRLPSRCQRGGWGNRVVRCDIVARWPGYRGRSLVVEAETRIVSSAEKLARSALARTTKVLFLDVAWEVGERQAGFLWKGYVFF